MRLTPRRCASLSELDNNALSGTIPASLSSLTNLQWLCGRARCARRERARLTLRRRTARSFLAGSGLCGADPTRVNPPSDGALPACPGG